MDGRGCEKGLLDLWMAGPWMDARHSVIHESNYPIFFFRAPLGLSAIKLFFPGKRRVKRRRVRREIQFADERATFRRAVDAVHAAVFPFD
jgi:hypothetical protein